MHQKNDHANNNVYYYHHLRREKKKFISTLSLLDTSMPERVPPLGICECDLIHFCSIFYFFFPHFLFNYFFFWGADLVLFFFFFFRPKRRAAFFCGVFFSCFFLPLSFNVFDTLTMLSEFLPHRNVEEKNN